MDSLDGTPGSIIFFVFAAEYIVFLMVAGLVLFIFQKSGSRLRPDVVLSKNDSFGDGAESRVWAPHLEIRSCLWLPSHWQPVFFARGIFGEIIRFLAPRARPFVWNIVTQLVPHNPAELSFPSGHALFMFGLATSLFMIDKKWGSVYLLLAALSSFARVAVGVHYPADIIAGALLGVLAAVLTKLCFDFAKRRWKSSF